MTRQISPTDSAAQAEPAIAEPTAPAAAAPTVSMHPVVAALRSKNAKMAFALASQCSPEELLAVRSGTFTLLHEAALRGDLDLAKLTLKAGADAQAANAGGWFPLLLAAAHPPVVELLLANKADANQSDANGLTPLAAAFSRDSLASAKMLLAAGARPDGAQGANWPPLFSAAASSDAALDLLEKSGAQMALRSPHGQSALHAAAAHIRPESVERLARAGAGLNWTDANGDTALHLAVRAGNETAAHALLDLGAHPAIENLDGKAPQDLAEEGGALRAALAQAEASRGRQVRVGKRPAAEKKPKAKAKADDLALGGEEAQAKAAKAKDAKPAAKKTAKPAAAKKVAAKKAAAKKAIAKKAAKPAAEPAAAAPAAKKAPKRKM